MPKRYRITGVPMPSSGFANDAAPEYFTAEDPDDAAEQAGFFYRPITMIEEVADDAGRGWLWRLLNRLRPSRFSQQE